MKDKIQISAAIILIIVGFIGFYWFSDKSSLVRISLLLVSFAIAMGLGWFTNLGQEFVVYTKESIDEAKKVVWPTRKETFQTTGVITIFAITMAVFLWAIDSGLTFLLTKLIGNGA